MDRRTGEYGVMEQNKDSEEKVEKENAYAV
jgi:hypothetical protein